MIEYAVKKRKITLLFFLMAIVVGLFSFTQLPQQEMPDVVIKQAMVTTVYAGATPEKVEQTVTKVLEQKIKEVQHIKTVTSTSASSVSTIMIEAEDDADAAATWDQLRKKVQDAIAELPADADQPVVNDNLTKSFIESYAITAETAEELYALNDLMIRWKDQLRAVSGVSEVDIRGIPLQEVRIDIDTEKLRLYGIAWEQVLQAVEKDNERVPTGSLDFNERTYQLTVPASEDPAAIRDVLIARAQSGSPIHLRDVGDASLVFQKPDYYAYYNGQPAITINLSGETGSDVPTMARLVEGKMEELRGTLPGNVEMMSLFAQSDRVSEIFGDLSHEMMIAIAAVILICTLGLNLLTSAFVALAIPVSIALGLVFLPMLDITLNQITVVGLIIVLGILVDDAVVVNDNIERRLTSLGESPSEAAARGTKEVALSILTATLATISAFAPLLFLQGDVGAFIRPIPIVISLTMLASMLMSLTIIPIFREWYDGRTGRHIKRAGKPPGLLGRQIEQLTTLYAGRAMPRLLRRPLVTGLAGLIAGTLAYGLVFFTPIELFPESERPEAKIDVAMPTGTSLQATDRLIRDIAGWVSEQPETASVSYGSGGGAPRLFSDLTGGEGARGTTVGQLAVLGEKGVFDVEDTVEKWRDELAVRYPEATISIRVPRLGIPVGSPVSIRISGEDTQQLQRLAEQVKEAVAAVPGTTNVRDDFGIESYTLDFQVNKQAMDTHMVTYNDLTRALRLLGDGLTIGNFDTGSELVDINLYMQNTSADPNLLFRQLSVTNAAGRQVPLAQLAEMKPGFSVQQIKHYNLERTVTVEADVIGRTATEVMTDVNAALAGMTFPDRYRWDAGGETSEQAEIFASLGKLSIVVVFLILLLITMQFYSVSTPIIIMTTVYLAAAGGIIGVFLSGMPIGFMSIMGIIALAGIVVRNGIVLIEFIEEARHAGADLKEAVMAAAAARFRPILLTSLTAIVGMIPIATIGDILFRPMAATIIFGMIFSTVLTLFVVPSLYMVLAQYKLHRQRKKEQAAGSGHTASM